MHLIFFVFLVFYFIDLEHKINFVKTLMFFKTFSAEWYLFAHLSVYTLFVCPSKPSC